MLYTYINCHAGTPDKNETKTFSIYKNRFIIIYSSSGNDLYTMKVHSLEHNQCYNIVIGKEKYVYIIQQVRRYILLCVCVFFSFILDIKFVGRTSRGHPGGRSHRIFHPPSFCGACLYFSREKDAASPFPRRP